MDDICDKIRFSLSYKAGKLRFTDFDIIETPEYSKLVEKLRTILLDHRLDDIDVDEILKITCPIDEQCIRIIAHIITEYQMVFTRNENNTQVTKNFDIRDPAGRDGTCPQGQ